MKKKNTNIEKRNIRNLISFFVEFLICSTIFTNCLQKGKIAQFLVQHLSLSLNSLMFISLTVLLLSASLRPLYAKYLNQQMSKGKQGADNKLVTNKQKDGTNSYDDKIVEQVHQLNEINDSLWQVEEVGSEFIDKEADAQPKKYMKVYKR